MYITVCEKHDWFSVYCFTSSVIRRASPAYTDQIITACCTSLDHHLVKIGKEKNNKYNNDELEVTVSLCAVV